MYRLYYKEGIGSGKFFTSFTAHYCVGEFLNAAEMCQFIRDHNSFRAVWEFGVIV